MKRIFKIGMPVMFSFVLVLAGCTNDKPSSTKPKDTKDPSKPTEIAKEPDVNFSSWGYDLQATRHVPATQINKDNIKDLGVVWETDLKKHAPELQGGNQSFSPVINGVIYATGSYANVFAFEAVTGKLLWHWQPDKEIMDHIKEMGMFGSNRGVAVAEGKVFVLISDNRLAAIDQKTGKTVKVINLWETIPDVTAENGYYETTAPIYFKGKLFIGSSGGDNGVRGFVMAYNSSDLTPAWDEPFWVVPPKGQDWLAGSQFNGGGAVWCPVAIDPETDIMYFGTGNPAPDFYGASRPGDNPYTDSVVAVDSNTGKIIWYQQEVTHDLWDYDAAATPMVLKATVGGKERKVVVQGGKSAEWFAWDAATGDPIYENVAFGKVDHPEPTPEGVLVYPGVLGGENYAPETYDPEANYVLIPGIEQPSVMKVAKNEEEIKTQKDKSFFGALDMGTIYEPAPDNVESYGTVTAIDMNTGKIAYQNKTEQPMRGGFTSTSAGIAFYGELNGKFHAIETKTGKMLWEFQTSGESINSAPSIFIHDGKQYIAQTTGGQNPKLIVFGLGGDQKQGTSQSGDNNTSHTK